MQHFDFMKIKIYYTIKILENDSKHMITNYSNAERKKYFSLFCFPHDEFAYKKVEENKS